MVSKDKSFSRVILEKNGVKKRLCSLHLDLSRRELLIVFKKPLTVIGQWLSDESTGKITPLKNEIKKIEHLHYIISQHKILATYREKGIAPVHTSEMIFDPKVKNGQFLQWFMRLIPQDAHLLPYTGLLTSLDLPLVVPASALSQQYALDFWLGVNFNPTQGLQLSKFFPTLYKKNEKEYYTGVFGEKEIYTIYIVMCLPKEVNKITTTRLIIPKLKHV